MANSEGRGAERLQATGLFATTVDEVAADGKALTDRVIALVYQELPSYAPVPMTSLQASTQRNLNIALRALRERVAPSPQRLSEAEITVRERVSQGVPVEDMMRAYRINIGVIENRFVEGAFSHGVPATMVLEGSRLLWAVADAFTTRLALSYQELEIENALHDSHRRSALVRGLLAGTIDSSELASQCALFGIDSSSTYSAIRARGMRDRDLELIRRELERRGSSPTRPALVAVVGGDIAGIVVNRPTGMNDVVVGVGAEVALPTVADSFRTASRILEAAVRLNKRGVFNLADLSWRLAAVDQTEVGAYLIARYLAPLRELGEFGHLIEETLRCYLSCGQSISRAATTLIVHENTLRHRLNKFTEITGASLSSTDAIVELAWALEMGRLAPDRRATTETTAP